MISGSHLEDWELQLDVFSAQFVNCLFLNSEILANLYHQTPRPMSLQLRMPSSHTIEISLILLRNSGG
jgi:hypothetical protein